ncbi:hypothetical protein L5I01_21950 [Gordonia sp. HY442]|uniref:hypothetical protein n=1 Tax=Gordonia zhenghanii TaxID=2911516 RepID=UPI001F41B299|nr:hypothetical protein [Gordonia zhenghanii]MCF8606019.1 hypothetical protein [Gordonia zhenghanii]
MGNTNTNTGELIDRVFCTDLLRFLCREAIKRTVSPWAALSNTLDQIALAIPYEVAIQKVRVGNGPIPLNTISMIVGPPGAGKGISSTPILSLDPTTTVFISEDGWIRQSLGDVLRNPITTASAPAMAGAYIEYVPPRRAKAEMKDAEGNVTQAAESAVRGHTRQTAGAAYFRWTEVEELAEKTARGDALSSELRKLWVCEPIGTYTKDAEKRLMTRAGEYRAVVSIHTQPRKAGGGLVDEDGGLGSRWVFFSADFEVPDGMPMPRFEDELGNQDLTLPDFDGEITVESSIDREMFEDRLHKRFQDGRNKHRNLRRLKLAALFAVMHGSTDVTRRWWDVAGAVLEHSDAVHEHILAEQVAAEEEVSLRRGEHQAIRREGEASRDSKVLAKTIERIPEVIERKCAKLGRSPIPPSYVMQTLTATQKRHYDAAIKILCEQGAVRMNSKGEVALREDD